MSRDTRSWPISPATAQKCLERAAAAYHDVGGGTSYAAAGCKFRIENDHGEVFVAFRGTANLENLYTDLRIKLVNYMFGPGKVHEGFWGAFGELLEQLQKLVKSMGRPTVRVTGHSLGGALATLAALFLALQGYNIECVTFGCPKVGDEEFCSFYRVHVPKTVRFVNKFDPVPRLLHSKTCRVKDDADFFHMMLGKLITFPQARLTGGEYAHVCDEVRLDGAVMSSFDHWRAFAAAFTQNIGTNDKQRKAWLQAIAPHDVKIYEENFGSKKPSERKFGGSLKIEDVQFLLGIAKTAAGAYPGPTLAAAAAVTALAMFAFWRMKASDKGHVEEEELLTTLEKEMREATSSLRVEDLPHYCESLRAQLETDLENHARWEDMHETVEVLCHATATCVEGGIGVKGDDDPLAQWRSLAPLLGRVVWNYVNSPGEGFAMIPSMHVFQDLALEDECLTTGPMVLAALAWAPDDVEVRATIAFQQIAMHGKDQLPPAAIDWFNRYAQLMEEPSYAIALDYDNPEFGGRILAVKTSVVVVPLFVNVWSPKLIMAVLRRINLLSLHDENEEVRHASSESLQELLTTVLGLDAVLRCSQDEDKHLRRDAILFLKDLWEHSPNWLIEELGRLAGDESEHLGPAAEEALGFLWPEEMVNPKACHVSIYHGNTSMSPAMETSMSSSLACEFTVDEWQVVE